MLLPLSQPGPVAAAAALVVEDIIRRCGTEFEVRAGPDARSQKWPRLRFPILSRTSPERACPCLGGHAQ